MLAIALSPAGLPYVASGSSPAPVVAAFERDAGLGLFELGARDVDPSLLDPTAAFWRELGGSFVRALAKLSDVERNRKTLDVEAPGFESFVLSAPPMRGAEYLSLEVLDALWRRMGAALQDDLRHFDGSVAEYLGARSPRWHLAGRVCFHLAENRDDELPFAFVATYSDRDFGRARGPVRNRPLGRALQAYVHDKAALLRLLEPIKRASEACEWVRELVESNDIFHPLAWSVEEAHRLLASVPALEAAGVLVRVPDWWRGRATRPRVTATVGASTGDGVGLDALLDFSVSVAIDGKELAEDEWRAIAEAESSLVFLRGRWVEIDRDRLDEVLSQWRALEAAAADGLSMAEGLRLLAGLPADPTDPSQTETTTAWSEVVAGKALQSTLQALRQPGADGPSPGRALRATLRPYQKAGLSWLWALDTLALGGCLADDMGLGKTLQVIALLLVKRRRKAPASLVVVPASLVGNWQAELARFAPTLRVLVAHRSVSSKSELEAIDATQVAEHDVVITTYGSLHRWAWLGDIDWAAVFLDEAQAIKNPGTRQTKAAKKLRARTRFALTGTPVENRIGDLWSIFDFINPGLLGTAKQFTSTTSALAKRNDNPYAPLRSLIAPYLLRRMKTDPAIAGELPEKTEVDAYCSLTPKQAGHYQAAVKLLSKKLETSDGTQRRGLVLAFLTRLKQICNHPSQWLGDGEYAPKASGKFLRLREIAEAADARQERALVFTQYREMVEPLASFLESVFGRPGLVLHGGTRVKKRRELVETFAEERGPPFFVISLKAGGTGLNLTAASHVIHFDRWWNPAVEDQATDRAFRLGQTKNVLVHKLICRGTVEERIDAVIKDKRKLITDVVDAGSPVALTELDDDALLDLVSLDLDRAVT